MESKRYGFAVYEENELIWTSELHTDGFHWGMHRGVRGPFEDTRLATEDLTRRVQRVVHEAQGGWK